MFNYEIFIGGDADFELVFNSSLYTKEQVKEIFFLESSPEEVPRDAELVIESKFVKYASPEDNGYFDWDGVEYVYCDGSEPEAISVWQVTYTRKE